MAIKCCVESYRVGRFPVEPARLVGLIGDYGPPTVTPDSRGGFLVLVRCVICDV